MTSPRYACLHCNASVSPGVCTCNACLREGHVTHRDGGCDLCQNSDAQTKRQLQDSVTAVLKDMLFLSLMTLVIPLSCLMCAPAPKSKKAAAFSPVGEWSNLAWSGGSGRAIFHRDGTFSCYWGLTPATRARWDGRWELKGDTLHTWNWAASSPPEEGSERAEHYHWPLVVERFSPKLAEGHSLRSNYSGRWRLEK